MEPIAISKATLGLDQSDAVGAVPGAQGAVASELFVALLTQALPAATSPETPGISPAVLEMAADAIPDLAKVDAAEGMVSALAAATLTAQRGVQMAQGDVPSPALVTINNADIADVATPSLTVSIPTGDVEIDAAPTVQLVVKTDAVNHELIARIPLEQVKPVETSDAQAEEKLVPAATVETVIVAPVPAVGDEETPDPHPTTADMNRQAIETYGPVLAASHKAADVVVDEIALPAPAIVEVIEGAPVQDHEHEDVIADHITIKLEAKINDMSVSANAQTMMMAQLAPHVQIIEARIVTQQTEDVEPDAETFDGRSTETIPAPVAETKRETEIFEIDPALAAQLTVQAPPASTASKDATSEPDLVQHRRATIETPVVVLKHPELLRSEVTTQAPVVSAPQLRDEHAEPVVVYTPRNSANGGDTTSYDDDNAHQNEPRHDQPQKSNPIFTRANSDRVKDDGMNITTDTVLARIEGATKDIRDLARFNVSEVEVSLANTPRVETQNTAPGATPDATALTVRADSTVEQTQTTSASDDSRRAAANDIRLRALERMVVTAAREGSDTIKMQLYPPGLGQVIIRLNMEGSRLRLSTRTSNADATEALQKIEQSLREALSMNGLDLTQFDVSEDGQQRDRASHQQAEQTHPKRGSFSDEVFAIDMNA